MDEELYDKLYGEIVTYFGAGDVVVPGDRETCAEQIVKALETAGYRKADEARKETAKEVLRELWANAEFEPLYDNDDGGYVRLGELEQIADKYGVMVKA